MFPSKDLSPQSAYTKQENRTTVKYFVSLTTKAIPWGKRQGRAMETSNYWCQLSENSIHLPPQPSSLDEAHQILTLSFWHTNQKWHTKFQPNRISQYTEVPKNSSKETSRASSSLLFKELCEESLARLFKQSWMHFYKDLWVQRCKKLSYRCNF